MKILILVPETTCHTSAVTYSWQSQRKAHVSGIWLPSSLRLPEKNLALFRRFLHLSQLSSSILHSQFQCETFPPNPLSFSSGSTVAPVMYQLQQGLFC